MNNFIIPTHQASKSDSAGKTHRGKFILSQNFMYILSKLEMEITILPAEE